MRIWIDILHTPQFNFYKNFIISLATAGHEVFVTVLGRGKLPVIACKELSPYKNVRVFTIGRHRMTKTSAIFEANLLRFFRLLWWATGKKIDFAFSNGHQCCLIAKILGIPAASFEDDPQSLDSKLKTMFSIKEYLCVYRMNGGIRKNEEIFPALKEWAYLNPRNFVPDSNVLGEYGLKPHSFLFFREVSVGTVNYAGQAPDSILQIASIVPKDIPVVLSLERKDKRELYPENWILLQEPVKDIHSLIYYSCGLVSSGDSMAREAALLGVPSYYLGIRYDMPANAAASAVANLHNRLTCSIEEWLAKTIDSRNEVAANQTVIRNSIDGKFTDLNEFMSGLCFSAKK